ncbi:MAG TPA: DegQ family serine endoprotease [Caulobacteraceae bacterium]|nr:DegQ family serine endoprotease [Caulobacteraceae bacterium]
MKAYRALIPALVLLAACSQPSPSQAQVPGLAQPTRSPPGSEMAMKSSFAPVVKRAAPAVVNVYARRRVRQRVDPFWEFFGGGAPRERVQQSLGSGAIVRADGIVLTNHHNIEGAQEVMVVTADRREWPATVLLDDPRSDLAVLKIDTKGERLPTLAIDDQEVLEVGDLVLAIGNPFGVGQTVTNGIVSALARSNVGITDYSFFIQTDAAINPGNSGGPLVDMDGDLIGINTAILSRSGNSSGVGFAIPAAMTKQVLAAALGGSDTVVRPWLGARTQTITGEIARSLGLAAPRGVLVADVWPGGAAARAGLRDGDIIVAVAGQPVNDEGALTYQFGARRIGETVPVTVLRDDRETTLNVRAEAAPRSPAADERTITGRNPLSGATVVNLSPAAADELGIDPFNGPGVLVTRVGAGFARDAGFQPGDMVSQVNGRDIRDVRDLASVLSANTRIWRVTVQRGGRSITADFRT